MRWRLRGRARWALLALLTACGGGGVSGGGDGSVARGCDPIAQAGCSGGQKCALVCNGTVLAFACTAESGTASLGKACSMTDDCLAGGFCAASANVPTPVCVQFCATKADCPSGTCDSLPVTLGTCREPMMVSVCQ